jgi:serine/threonine protein kinase
MSWPSSEDLPVTEVLRIARECGRFEAALKAWADGPPPALEEYLGDAEGPARAALLRHLLQLELTYRSQHGQPLTPEEFRQRFPDLGPLESILPVHELSHGTADSTATFPSSVLAPTPPCDIPPCPEGYEILAELGRGGMGVVYKARQTKLGRPVALKMLRAGAGKDERILRFHSEAKALARFQHPNIVQVYDVGESQGRPYFAFEYVRGGSLDKQTCRQPQIPRDAAHLVSVLARAVDAAHRAGILHRDLKPANILLAPSRPGDVGHTAWGLPKLSDFGLARSADGSPGLTADGVVLGTASYMAPEQAEGDSSRIGPGVDVYGLGAILYELLSGRPPFHAESLSATLTQVMTRPPEPLRELRPDVPVGLEAICLRCLAKRPQDRYPSAARLAEALDEWLAGQEPQASSLPAPMKIKESRRQWPRRWIIGVLPLAIVPAIALLVRQCPSEPKHLTATEWKGFIDLLVWEKGNRRRQRLRLNDPAALPLKGGDMLRLVVQINRPAYLYVLWIDTEGEVAPLYPWQDNDWARRGAEEPRQRLELPEAAGEGTNLPPEKQGMDTLLLLVRPRQLPADVDLRQRLANLPRQGLLDLRAAAWFENGRLVEDEVDRAPQFGASRKVDELVQTQALLHEKLADLFVYTRAVCFANQGR